MEWLLPLLGGLGGGTLLTTIVNNFLANKKARGDRHYAEKREAYVGLLNSFHLAAVSPSDKNSKDYALWQTRVRLFGSPKVTMAAQHIVDTNTGPREARDLAFEELLTGMREDLKK